MRTKRKLRGGLLKDILTPPLTGKEAALKREQDSLKTLIAEEDKCSKKDAADLDALIADPANAEFSKILEYVRDSDDTPQLFKLPLARNVIELWPDRGKMATAKKVNTQDELVASYANKCVKAQTATFLNQLKTVTSSSDKDTTKEMRTDRIQAQLYGRAVDLVNGIGTDRNLVTDDTGLIIQDVLSLRAAQTYSSCGIVMSAESFNKLADSDKKLVVDHYNSKKIKIPDGYVVPAAGGKRRRTKRKALRKYASTRSRARRGP